MSNTFDRVRPRTGEAAVLDAGVPDSEGKRALFSAAEARPAAGAGAVTITCSRCGARTVTSPVRALRAAVPSLHVFPLRRRFPSYLRCPACHRPSWVRLGVRL